MALVNIEAVIVEVKRYIKSCPVGSGIEILSYKRNRTVAVTKKESALYTVQESGYRHQVFEVGENELFKRLKSIIKREFPRSRKLRLFKFQDKEQLNRIHQKI